MNIKRIAVSVAVFAAMLSGLNSCVVGNYMVKYALLPEEHGNDFVADSAKTENRYPGIMAWYNSLHSSGVFKDTVIVNRDGYRLHAVYAPAKDPSAAKGTAIVIHGYTDNHICFLNLGRMYRDDLNYNVLMPDLFYHGYSEGTNVQMGWFDRLDIKQWIAVAHGIWNDPKMVVHGVSMGGATTMMVSGEEDLPDYVKAFVDDCGYSSVWDQFAHNLKQQFHLPPFPVLTSASIVCKHKYGWSFKEASSVAQLAKCTRPMLFIHGDSDDFVPTAHVYKNYEAKVQGYKELWIAPDTDHAMAYKNYPEEYTKVVKSFLEKVDILDNLRTGDLVFVGIPADYSLDSTGMASGIAEATGSGDVNYIHAAILEVTQEGPFIIDATIKRGVARYPLDEFFEAFSLKDGRLPVFEVMRPSDLTEEECAKCVENAKAFIGEPYDQHFLPDNGEKYCTELVYDSYLKNNGEHVFSCAPMNFKDKDGNMPPYWTQLFARLGEEVPQGVSGTNPQAMRQDSGLSFVKNLKPETADCSDRYQVSFTYDGTAFSPEKWSSVKQDSGNGKTSIIYTSPDGRLRLRVTYVKYSDSPVVEVRPVLECATDRETGIIDGFKSLDLSVPCNSNGIRIRRITGSKSEFSDFCRHDVLLQKRQDCSHTSMNSEEGRSAAAWLPYFGIDFGARSGLEMAIGWTGSWKVDFDYSKVFRFSTGLGEETHFKMRPGESFQMPYLVIYEREGKTVEEGLVDFHRFVISHKSPRDSKGELFEPLLPLTGSGGNKTDANVLMIMDKATALFNVPFNTFWIDAGWYGDYHEVPQDSNCGPYWYKWAGNWKPNTFSHPDGNLRKISDAAHAKGMKFLLWFEPERATVHAPIVREHPEYFHRPAVNPSDECYLLDLGNEDARRWITEEVSRNIRESGVDIFREDFNLDPLPIWRDADSADRKGVSEIKHINGLYAFWDELHRRFPDMMFENCASGGRRMDIEMMSRSHSYCRDDAHMFKGCEEMVQNITLNSTPYIPFTGGETFTIKPMDTYGWLSCIAAGTVFTPTDFQGMLLSRDPGAEEVAWFNRMLSVSDRVRHLFFGDFYNLSNESFDGSDIWCAYQLNCADEGFFMIFRRQDCSQEYFHLDLRGIDPAAKYTVETFEGKTVTMKGADLASQTLKFDSPRSYRLVFYRKK